jgi:hypothetical protein
MHEDRSDKNRLDREPLDGESPCKEFEVDHFDSVGHQADYNFSYEQLEWIEIHYGNSERFMVSYGLKFYDAEDVEEAKAIVDAIVCEEC